MARRTAWAVAAAGVALFAGAAWLAGRSEGPAETPPTPRYDEAFWRVWGAGDAELAGYDLIYPRYGAPRHGTAVTVFVTETFAEDLRVKSEDPRRPASRTFPVIKLNLIQDFSTGIYDYNLMTGAFVALADSAVARAGRPAKVVFSAQEWCGQTWSQLVFDPRSVVHTSHSYFDGEGDERTEIDAPPDGVSEDALPLWARGLAAPALEPGQSRSVHLFGSLELARLTHVKPLWATATLSRSADAARLEVPAGAFEVERLDAVVDAPRVTRSYPPGGVGSGGTRRRWTFWVERQSPRRIVAWERDDGVRAELLGTKRLRYWEMNGVGFEAHLRDLGLVARPPRTP